MIPLRDNIPSGIRPVVNWALILINIYVFYLEIRFPTSAGLERFISDWAVVPRDLWANFGSEWTSLITATFLHGGWMHIIGNMLFLYIFGDNVEERMGHVRYLIFYVGIGMIANGTQAFISSGSKVPMLGASGAVAGVLGAYFFYYPYSRVLTLIPLGFFSRIVEVPAFLFLGFWFLMQAVHGVGALAPSVRRMQDVGGVAWWAHASGFVAGLIAGPALSKRKRAKGRQG